MGGFATNGVNMTKLESYMVDGNFFATQFYADVDGHPEDKNLAFALEELKFFSSELRIVGVYPGHPFRATLHRKEKYRALIAPQAQLVLSRFLACPARTYPPANYMTSCAARDHRLR